MSGTYFSVGDKVNIGQTDVEIKCEGSDQFKSSQVIGIFIPPSVSFFSGKDTTLNFDIEIKPPASDDPTKYTLDSITGANGLFSKCVVYAGNRQTVLETLDHYSSWCSIKYSYDTNDSIKGRRAMTEGTGEYVPSGAGDLGTPQSIQNNTMYSPYMEQANFQTENISAIATAVPFVKASVSIPIHMGMFANNSKAVPNVLMGGCYVELTCEKDERVIRALDSTTITRKQALNPVFWGINAGGGKWTGGQGETEFFTGKWNSQSDPQHSPFQVGETIGCINLKTGDDVDFTPALKITGIESGGDPNYPIKYTCASTSPDVDIIATSLTEPDWVFYSKRASTVAPKYELSNVRMIVRQLNIDGYEAGVMAKMKSGGQILYDIPSVSCGLTSATTGELQATLPIECQHSKARSVLCMPTDNDKQYTVADNVDSDKTYLIDTLTFNPVSKNFGINNFSDRSGVSGIGDFLSSYNFLIDQKIVPSRRVQTNKSSSRTLGMNADHIIELEKSLNQSHGTPARSFANFRSNFLVGRALTLDPNTVYDGRGKDMRLLVRYEETTAPQKNKLWKSFISHIKTISIQGDSINVQQ